MIDNRQQWVSNKCRQEIAKLKPTPHGGRLWNTSGQTQTNTVRETTLCTGHFVHHFPLTRVPPLLSIYRFRRSLDAAGTLICSIYGVST